MDYQELFKLIQTRRSIRRFQDKPVPEDLLRKALELATWLPMEGIISPGDSLLSRINRSFIKWPTR